MQTQTMLSLSQKDSRWRLVLLGASRMTVGAYGCTTTGLSIISYYAHQFIDPGTFARMSELYTGVNHSMGPGLVLWAQFTKLLKNIKSISRHYVNDPEMIQEAINNPSKMPMLQVYTGINRYPEHWVVPIRPLEGGDYWIMDTLDGQEKSLLSEYRSITGFVIAEAVDGFEFSDPKDVTPPQKLPVVGFIKAQTSEKVYYFTGDEKTWVPDWDSFKKYRNLMKCEDDNVEGFQTLTDAIVMAIPEVDPLPKLK